MNIKYIYTIISAMLISTGLWVLLNLPFTEVLEKHKWVDNYILCIKWVLSISYFILIAFSDIIKNEFNRPSNSVIKFIIGAIIGIILGISLGFVIGVSLGIVIFNSSAYIAWVFIGLIFGFIFGLIIAFIPCFVFTVIIPSKKKLINNPIPC